MTEKSSVFWLGSEDFETSGVFAATHSLTLAQAAFEIMLQAGEADKPDIVVCLARLKEESN